MRRSQIHRCLLPAIHEEMLWQLSSLGAPGLLQPTIESSFPRLIRLRSGFGV